MKKVLFLGQYRDVVNENCTNYYINYKDQQRAISKDVARVKVVQEQTRKIKRQLQRA
jgi:hypothetical protein